MISVKYIAEIETPTVYTGYLVDGTMIVPMDTLNRHYKLVQEWIAEGNTPEPAYTKKEMEEHKNNILKAEAYRYLDSTDWYVTREHDTGEAMPDEVKTKRAEARALLQ